MLRWTVSLCAVVALALLGGGAARLNSERSDTLAIGAYSVVRDAFHDVLLPAFAKRWEQQTGRKLRFEESYSGSGAQARAIASGFDADVAVLSLEGDIDKLVKAGLVRKDWNAGPHRGMITRSLVVIGYREGNPKGIRDWEDLTKPGVEVVYPDPKTSGGARWNINAIYGAGLLRAGRLSPDRAAGTDLLSRVQANVLTMDASGRQSMATFERGTGDAVVTYENELLLQKKLQGRAIPYVIPRSTLLIEGPAAVVDAAVKRHGNRALAEAFVDYLRSEEAQRVLVDFGFRPLDASLETDAERAPLPSHLFTMADLGGWGKINKEVFDTGGVWDSLFTDRAPKGRGR
jgi:sulfate transport system substrate-binding protein